ncbi:hypothetical protein [Thiomicrospira sp. WB1]|uniref:hypothetical protein n=1 Tax=Thiomicrospira sp. WB1 TaxID=1685380 RepID=UPI000AD291D5|nr:hypothetical protein [Thiomicrospira sp. WB1]
MYTLKAYGSEDVFNMEFDSLEAANASINQIKALPVNSYSDTGFVAQASAEQGGTAFHFTGYFVSFSTPSQLSDVSGTIQTIKKYDASSTLVFEETWSQGISLENFLQSENENLYDGNDRFIGSFDQPVQDEVRGFEGNDRFQGNGGEGEEMDHFYGGNGIDTAIYRGNFSEYTIETASFTDERLDNGTLVSGTVVRDNHEQRDGSDALLNVERLEFADKKVALDIDNGHAGQTAKILGAVFGADAVTNQEYAGIGLHYLDNGWPYEQLMGTALETALGQNASNEDVVTLLYENLTQTSI